MKPRSMNWIREMIFEVIELDGALAVLERRGGDDQTFGDMLPTLAWSTDHTELLDFDTVDSRYLEHTLSRISRYLELFSWSLQHLQLWRLIKPPAILNLAISNYLLSRTNYLAPNRAYFIHYLEPFLQNPAHTNHCISTFYNSFSIQWK